jgi:hypothetical protein
MTLSLYECSTDARPAILRQRFPIPLKTTLRDKLSVIEVSSPIAHVFSFGYNTYL